MNPNEYDDERYCEASVDLHSAIIECWMAGAGLEVIQGDVENAIEDAGGPKVRVSIDERASDAR